MYRANTADRHYHHITIIIIIIIVVNCRSSPSQTTAERLVSTVVERNVVAKLTQSR